nr:MAG TPA: hypothetical protein [Myoviridae sp. ctNqw6]
MSSVFFFIVLSFIYISYNNAILILLYLRGIKHIVCKV